MQLALTDSQQSLKWCHMNTRRIDAMIDTIKNPSCRACLLEEPIDLYYFTGLSLSAGSLLIAPNASALFVDGRYYAIARKCSPLEVHLKEGENLKNYLKQKKVDFIAVDSSKMSVDAFEQKKKEFLEIRWVTIPYLTRALRSIKDPEELAKLRRSAHLTKQAFIFAKQALKEGVSELEIAWKFESFCREHGASRMAFEPIVAFGDHCAFPHHHSTNRKFRHKEGVLFDVGCVIDSYASDMTRTVIPMDAPEKIQRIGEIVKQAQAAACNLCKPGIKVKELDEAAREVLRKGGLEEYFTHSLGHGIGLETHEFPRLTSKGMEGETVLQEGMVITIEPGLYLPEIGGARHEDTVIVTKDGMENLYQDLR